jgi:hypothetical protein
MLPHLAVAFILLALIMAYGSPLRTQMLSKSVSTPTALPLFPHEGSSARIVPGDKGEKCETITAASNSQALLRLYLQNLVSQGNLMNYLKLTVEAGTSAKSVPVTSDYSGQEQLTLNPSDCSDFMPQSSGQVMSPRNLGELSNAWTGFDTGMDIAEANTGTHTHMVKVSWTFDTTGLNQNEVNSLMGSGVTVDLVWDLQLV